MELAESIKALLTNCVKELVDNPDDCQIEVRNEEDEDSQGGYTIFADVKVNPADIGKVVGRQGRTIKSLRTLVRALGAKQGIRVEVEIVEEDN